MVLISTFDLVCKPSIYKQLILFLQDKFTDEYLYGCLSFVMSPREIAIDNVLAHYHLSFQVTSVTLAEVNFTMEIWELFLKYVKAFIKYLNDTERQDCYRLVYSTQFSKARVHGTLA